ncbi:thymidine kinase [Jeotgalicoccus huakuii]|uniref:thymidine kinase n=1 Tax=Jeotgalicoccus TaxID=227979 RepID=UPI000424BB46|nr:MULTISPECIES: thymidine kinase [Jeotgalicoccus]MCK1976456.1 thymidine kinase [Jeotgalicoccus huakuii]QQD84370.1 thymidine kinase [Jeotgalicoccus sp. ATCC 8456]
MAKLYYRYGTMQSNKSNQIITTHYQYTTQGKRCLAFTSPIDSRSGYHKIKSRVGLELDAEYVTDDIFEKVKKEHEKEKVFAVLVDEAQFLSKKDIHNLSDIPDLLDIPVIAFGLKTDFRNELFEGSKTLLELADAIDELKTVCQYCNKKATLNLRMQNGIPTNIGETIQIGDEEYVPVCRKCYKERLDLI